MYDNEGNLTVDAKTQAEELVTKLGAICKEYHPAIVLFVLEAAMTEQINQFSHPLSELFSETMHAYKEKAAILITVSAMLKGKAEAIRNGASIEDILTELGAAVQESEPKE